MKKISQKINAILFSLRENEREYYLGKFNNYNNECGCSMGGVFSIVTLIGYVVFSFFFLELYSINAILKHVLSGFIITIIAGIVGKLIGIGIAKIKIIMLYRGLKQYHQLKKTNDYVNMYKMGR